MSFLNFRNGLIVYTVFAAFFLAGISINICSAQSINKERLDSLFTAIMSNHKGMYSIAVSKNDTIIYTCSTGYSLISKEEKIHSTIDTKYKIGSISKLFTATMILELVEEGKLSLTDTLKKFFPRLPNADKITITHLLQHRSGLFDFTEDTAFYDWMDQPKTQEEMLSLIASKPPEFAPDEKFAYSNTNYNLLAYIIEKICHQSYKDALRDRITARLGLENTYSTTKIDVKNKESYSYFFTGNHAAKMKESDGSVFVGSGSVVATPSDLNKFIDALFACKLVNKNSLELMKTMKDDYGMGMFTFLFYNKLGYGHTGQIDGFVSTLEYFPEDHFTVALCTNGTVTAISEVMSTVLKICYNKPYTISNHKTINVSPEELNKYLGIYYNKGLEMHITISKHDSTLINQATGQIPIPMEAIAKDDFKNFDYGIELLFETDAASFLLKQEGVFVRFTREK